MFRTIARSFIRLDTRVAVRHCQNRGKSTFKQANPQYGLLVCPAIAFGLGCWQIQRRSWKLGLIDEIRSRTEAPPVELPKDLREIEDMEYRKIHVRGVFDHDEEVYIGPRGHIDDGGIGFHVVTPLKLEDRDFSILVNRGWVPREKTNPATRREGQISGVVDIEGIVRLDEKKPVATKEIRSGAMFALRDIGMIAQTLGTAPVLIDATSKCSVRGGPIGGQTRIDLRNEHASYIITWFTLSAVLFAMWFKRYRSVAR